MNRALRFALQAVVLLGWSSASVIAHASTREWFSLNVGDQRVGYAYFDREVKKNGVVDVQYSRIAVTQFRRTALVERKVILRRDAKGALQSMETSSSAGTRHDSWQGLFDAQQKRMRRRIASSDRQDAISLPVSMHAPDERYGYLAPLSARTATMINYSYLEPSLALPTNMRASVIDDRVDAVPGVTHIRIALAATPNAAVEDVWIDKSGGVSKKEQPFFGQALRWAPCSANCDASIETPYDPMERLVVRSPFHVPTNAFKGPIRYVISMKNHEPLKLPVTKEQSVTSSADGVVVTICGDCGSETASNAAEVARYLQPNAWVQSDDKAILAFARRVTANTDSVSRRMASLVEAVRNHMNGSVDYLGYATAVDAYKSRSGDCTEFAVLLAALARADGIATRVVVGMAYADRFSGKKDVFSPHTWVQAWDGKSWTSYDAALESFDATHIAIAIGDGRPEQYEAQFKQLANLQIEKLGLVRDH